MTPQKFLQKLNKLSDRQVIHFLCYASNDDLRKVASTRAIARTFKILRRTETNPKLKAYAEKMNRLSTKARLEGKL